MERRTWFLGGIGALIIALVIGAVVLNGAGDAAAAKEQPVTTAKVVRGPLSALVSLHGTLTRRALADGSPYTVINRATGTYTKLPTGAKVDCGEVLYRVDDRPVLLLCGTVPAYRDLAIGSVGKDVRQLNDTLHALGNTDVDPKSDTFGPATRAALVSLQHDTGLDPTGTLRIDEAVFLPEALLVSKVIAPLGGSARPGAEVAEATSDSLEVQVSLNASQQGAVHEGDTARISLPGNVSVTGKVDRIGRVAQAPAGKDGEPGAATIPVHLSLDDPEKARGLDLAPVSVEITTRGVKSALSVPVIALVGKSGSGFGVEVVRASGQRDLVAVELGLFDTTAGRVQVTGQLKAGDRVVVPSS